MSRFIALHCGDETAALLANHPKAFLLLTQIAMRAKWRDCPITRLKAGQAFIGDFREAGLKSEKVYRIAKAVLSDCGLAAFQGTNKGTVATLLNTTIFSISADMRGGPRGGQEGEPRADKGRAKGGQGATNHTETQNTQREEAHPLPEYYPFERIPTTNRPQFEDIIKKIQTTNPNWKSALTRQELDDLLANGACFQSQETSDWLALKDWMLAKLPEGSPTKKPSKRCWFIKDPAGYFEAALQWKRMQPDRKPAPEVKVQPPEPTDADKAALAEVLKVGLLKANL